MILGYIESWVSSLNNGIKVIEGGDVRLLVDIKREIEELSSGLIDLCGHL
jgi:hypothetical protein